jgi:hypothetical protein
MAHISLVKQPAISALGTFPWVIAKEREKNLLPKAVPRLPGHCRPFAIRTPHFFRTYMIMRMLWRHGLLPGKEFTSLKSEGQ